MAKPGVVIYFNDARGLDMLSDEEAGRLFRAIILYARDGTSPPFAEGTEKLSLAWVYFRNAIDADTLRYAESVRKKSYAAYCRKCRSEGLEPLCYEEWGQEESTDITCSQMHSNSNPSTDTNANTEFNPNLISNFNSEERKGKRALWRRFKEMFGEYPSDAEEFSYLFTSYGEGALREAMEIAKKNKLRGNAAWLFVQTKTVYSAEKKGAV